MKRRDAMIAIYSRKSKFTGKGESIGNQVELCKEYVRNVYGEDHVERCVVFEDEGFSGGNLKRPAFQRMMADVRKGRFKAIAVYRLNRVSRNISDFAGLIDELTRLDVSFVSIREQFDTGTPMGRAMMYIISVFSQLERETIAERIRDNMHELAKTGRWLGGNTPTGYGSESVSNVTVDGKTRKACKLKLIPEEAELVKTVFGLYTETDSLTAVEAELLRRRLKTKRGNDFTRFSIKAILQNPVYMVADAEACRYFAQKGVEVYSEPAAFDGTCGIMAYNRTDQEKGKSTVYLPMEEWVISVGKHPGLISSGQWLAVQESLARNKSKAYRKPRSNAALLTGLLFCACGERMYPKLTKRQTDDAEAVYTYVCKMKERSKRERCDRRNANGNVLDSAVVEQIKLLTGDEQTFVGEMEKRRRLYTENRQQGGQCSELRGELARNEKTIDGLIDSMGLLSESTARIHIARRIEKLMQINGELRLRLRELEKLSTANILDDTEFDSLCQRMAVFRACIDEMSLEERRGAVRTVVRKVLWDGINAHVVLFGAEEETVFQ